MNDTLSYLTRNSFLLDLQNNSNNKNHNNNIAYIRIKHAH